MAKDKGRTCTVTFRVTEAEKEAILQMAKKSHLENSEYIRTSLLSKNRPETVGIKRGVYKNISEAYADILKLDLEGFQKEYQSTLDKAKGELIEACQLLR